MSVPPEQFLRIANRIDLSLVNGRLVVVIGVGTVGSQVALELARSGVGQFRFIDGDALELVNILRHALTERYVGRNKAEAMTEFLADELGTQRPEAVPRMVDDNVSDDQLDDLLSDADLIVSATDNEAVQRRIARRALALDIPTVLPALYRDAGGEVFVQLSSEFPCFLCWDGFRPESSPLRGVDALNVDAQGIIELGARLCLGLLDPSSEYAVSLRPEPGQRRPQLFIRNEEGTARPPIQWRPNCPSCAVGPARPGHPDPTPTRPGEQVREAWAAATAIALFGTLIVVVGGFFVSLMAAFLAAHSFQIYGKTGYEYGRALGLLLTTMLIAFLPAVAATSIVEFFARRGSQVDHYWDTLIRRGEYRRALLIAAFGPAGFLYLVHGFGPITPPPWWWVVAPICIALAHIGYLGWDRLEIEPLEPTGYWVGGAALCTFAIVAIIIGLPDPHVSPYVQAEVAQPSSSQVERERKQEEEVVNERAELERAEAEAEEKEPLGFLQPCGKVAASGAAVSAFHCTPGKVVVSTEYFAYKHEAEEALLSRAEEVEAVGIDSGCPTEAPATQAFTWEDENGETFKGLWLCFIEDRRIRYAWTNTSQVEYRYSEATFPSPHLRAAQQWWESPGEEQWRELPIESYPSRYKPCFATYAEGQAVEAVECEPSSAKELGMRLEYFPEWQMANAHFQEQLEALASKPQGSCPDGVNGYERFSDGDQVGGRLLCFMRQGTLVYEWVKPWLRLYGEAEFGSPDAGAAWSWWLGH